jgi:creatinine amidohydrolase
MMRYLKSSYALFALAVVLAGIMASSTVAAFAQPASSAAPSVSAAKTAIPAMRSRVYTSLTGYEINEYLKRNDVIFIPVGPVEVNDGNPVDVEYVLPLAYAIKLAEKSDGLVLPYVSYTDTGATLNDRATILVSAAEGSAYIKVIVRSLIRQGFRRIVFLSSHGPAFHTIVPAADDIFYETHVSSVWLEPGIIASGGNSSTATSTNTNSAKTSAAASPSPRKQRVYGAYKIVGRLNDMPVGLTQPPHEFEDDEGLNKINKIVGIWNGKVPAFYADSSQHGGFVTPVTAEQRETWGKDGAAAIEAEVNSFDINGLLEGLREHNEFTKRQEQRVGTLPGNKTSVNVKP